MNPEHTIEIGQRFPLTIKRLGINGEGIGYYKRTIVFVKGALPEEEVVAEVTEIMPRFATATIKKIRKPSKNRVTPPCEVYEACGGCQLQHLSYNKQLDFKRDMVLQSLEKFKPAGFEEFDIRPTIGMDDPWRYRNKAQFQVRKNEDDNVIAGLYGEGSHKLVNIDNCLVQRPETTKTVNVVKQLLSDLDIPIYDEVKHSGIIKTIVARVGIETGEVQLVLVTNSKKLPKKKQFLEQVKLQLPEIVSIMQNVNQEKTSLVMGEETIHLAGKESLTEKLDTLEFDLSARAFFQLNPIQTNVLYDEARKALDLQKDETLVDAYCGVGTIGLSLAKEAKEVRGMDTIPEAIADAKENAIKMGFDHVRYEVGKAESLLPLWLKRGFKPDALVVDPPRTGLDPELIKAIVKAKPKKMVYISCNPSTLGRDLEKLSRSYKVDYLQSVDMFPQTARCEVVVKLTAK
ncbi:23S rRNA (uracil(1939)-C(5))-methyltransferase RlmD [Carnobacterium divergens]|uniref:23S rRNA (Uracil(1939)-C(5))-methyltransferase RlmD n=1 Tax=Carnobacterium divergens TaxID=2748 RepID=A0A7Z8D0I2_CARDV|nr:23S rRNA (uracil(1939)-C(5))-methyltransferase RlmD [Carnobacterium divergens]TFI75037.1 23S rRNA (uracil(1939)-C(5))-methyltransferase RlmD [Carnobacterium divergens]TFI79400.1 23S rRNA (uracil(1939)-C(5))-methyltransferase RlmD [Carnobacterium divergens]TFI85732.1 23S rRNA (uracil(1939)-C(5))-methyltransferase RlmD [Carnobacterium divergens]TFI98332.1 23S rRNA (uracil(1939)-C(5))-methyltransferase RlmD [Carnobacterium divergens]TFJ14461.1 23S rRNA (uracil(1939)-C(5))-methyltransferase Rlm